MALSSHASAQPWKFRNTADFSPDDSDKSFSNYRTEKVGRRNRRTHGRRQTRPVVARSIGQTMCISLYPFSGIDVMIFPLAHGLGSRAFSRAFVGPEVQADTGVFSSVPMSRDEQSHSERSADASPRGGAVSVGILDCRLLEEYLHFGRPPRPLQRWCNDLLSATLTSAYIDRTSHMRSPPACHHPSNMATSEQARHSAPPSGWSPPKFVQSRQVLPDREASTYGDRCILT